MRFYQQATLCFVTSRKKMQSILICRSDCDANNIFVWVGECGLMPSPQPSPTGRGRKRSVRSGALTPALSHREREKMVCAVWCPHPGPLPWGEGVGRVQRKETTLFAPVPFLSGIHLIQITSGFCRRMAGGQGGVDIPWRHGVNDIRRLHLIAGEHA